VLIGFAHPVCSLGDKHFFSNFANRLLWQAKLAPGFDEGLDSVMK